MDYFDDLNPYLVKEDDNENLTRQQTVPPTQPVEQTYVENILRVGIEEQKAEKDYYIVRKKIEYSIPETGAKIFNFASGISLLLFYAFAMQCASTLAITKKETNSWKWPLGQLIFMSSFAYLTALLAYQILK